MNTRLRPSLLARLQAPISVVLSALMVPTPVVAQTAPVIVAPASGNTRVSTTPTGVTVVDIDRDSPAADFGFQPGDIVREVNGIAIDSADKLSAVSQQNTRWWRFTVERNGQILRQVLRY